MFRRIILSIVCVALGIAGGIGVLFALAALPVRFDHPVLRVFGIKKPQIIGFLPYWLLDKADKNYSSYITTLAYFGLTIDRDGKLLKLVNSQEEEPGWTNLKGDKAATRLTNAKQSNLKQSLLVFGADDEVISELLNDPQTSAKNLVADAAPIMRGEGLPAGRQGFTDLNLDIETFVEASDSARQAFTAFARTVKEELVAQQLGTLTVDVIAISLVKDHIVDVAAVGEFADAIVLMTYDYFYLGSFLSGPIAPIGGAGDVIEFDVETAIKEAIKVLPKEKILLGIPLYGYQWETVEGKPGSATIPGGGATASNRRVAEILKNCATCSATVDPVSREPSLIYPENEYFKQTFYEDESSLTEKLELAKKYQLGGVALWALGYEDDTMLRPLEWYKKSFELAW